MKPSETAKGRPRGWRWLCLMGITVPILISACAGGGQGNSSPKDPEIRAKHKKTHSDAMKRPQRALDRVQV